MNLKIKSIPCTNSTSVAGTEAATGQALQGINPFFQYVLVDWESNPARLVLEWIGMALAISASLIMSLSISGPPLFQILITWIISSSILLGCALSRGSTGMVIFNSLLIIIDVIGLTRLGF